MIIQEKLAAFTNEQLCNTWEDFCCADKSAEDLLPITKAVAAALGDSVPWLAINAINCEIARRFVNGESRR